VSAPQTLHELQTAILDAVAPPNWRDMNITAATLTLPGSGQLPELRLDCHVLQTRGMPEVIRRHYELRPIEAAQPAAPLDLDAMCDEAMQAVRRTAYKAAETVEWENAHAFEKARREADSWLLAGLRELMIRRIYRATFEPVVRQMADAIAAGGSITGPFTGGFTGGLWTQAAAYRPGDQLLMPAGTIGAVAGAALLAVALGWLGPAIDAEPDRRGEWVQAEQELQVQGTLARWEAEARAKCDAIAGPQGTYIQVDGGGIVCMDKRGRRARGAL
jgi:hypothetical protein